MCGILGLIRRQPVPESVVRRAVSTMNHRGPDDAGVHHLPQPDGSSVWLGHKRLSILDLSPRGHQPMADPTGRYWIVFNGEIYNYRELRGQLRQRGCTFDSDCDTEVILRAYEVWGEDCLDRLNGMFAFAIWDERAKTLFAARDRLGVKPFYYVDWTDGVAFASEIKALLQLPDVPRELNQEVLPKYLTFLWVPDPDTLFRGIKKLPPGHKLVWRDGQRRVTEWWDAPLHKAAHKSQDEWVENVRRIFAESVGKRLMSDVPLGVFLSGGLDSSAILAMVRRQTRDPIIAYTVGFRRQDLALDIIGDDVRYARLMAERMQPLDYHEIELAPTGFDCWPKLVWHLDEPLPDPAAISTYLICQAAKERATVMMAGVGGEEIFGGYPRHLAAKLALYYRTAPGPLRRGISDLVSGLSIASPNKMNPRRRNLKKFLKSAALPFAEAYLGFSSYYTPEELEPLLGRRVESQEVYDRHLAHLQRAEALEPLNRIFYLDLKTFLPCLNLAYGDKCSMAASVEVREPLLDYRLVELAMAMPARYKIHGMEQKYIFKRAADAWVPSEIVGRQKAGFSGPVRAWIKKDYRERIADLLSPARVRARGLFDPKEVSAIYDRNQQGHEDYALRLWAFVTLELWQQTFIDRNGEAPLT
jgi:asparagine synthase (glutamine-hydrolysing)